MFLPNEFLNMSQKKIFVIIGIVIIALVALVCFWKISAKPKFTTALVQKTTITQEVSASGKVQPPQTLNLYFKTGGKLIELKVKTGDNVEAGQILAKQDTTQLEKQLEQARAGVDAAQAKLNQLLAGASPESVALAQTAVANAQTALNNALAARNVAYQSALNSIRDSYVKADDAIHNYTDRLFTDPRGSNPVFEVTITTANGGSKYQITENDPAKKIMINSRRKNIETMLNEWKKSADNLSIQNSDNLELLLIKTIDNLQFIQQFLNDIAVTVNSYNSKNLADDTIYQNYRAGILTARTEIDGSLAAVIAAQSALKSADASVAAAQGAQKSAQDQLALVVAPARQTDAAAYIAAINQAQAAVEQISQQINDLTICAPSAGIIAATNGNVGEIISPSSPVIVLIPFGGLQIKLNVSEDNIINVQVGQPVDIMINALGGSNHLEGVVSAIDPAETIISGAVYYQTTVDFNQPDSRIRPGMTVNALIKTAIHKDTLVVPASAIEAQNGKKFVKILQNNKPIKQEITTGLESNDGMIEITSGLTEGQAVVLEK